MLTQAPLKIVDVSAVSSRMISRRQQLEPNRVELHAPQAEHPLQRHGKIAAALAIFRREPAAKKNGHANTKAENVQRSTLNILILNADMRSALASSFSAPIGWLCNALLRSTVTLSEKLV